MKKMNRKGFTIVELVIVIAVIAILAGVLIPTFSGIVGRAQTSATIQEARNMYTEYTGMHDYSNGSTPDKNIVIKVADNKFVAIKNGKINAEKVYETEALAITGETFGDGGFTFVYKEGNELKWVKDATGDAPNPPAPAQGGESGGQQAGGEDAGNNG